MKYLYIIRHAKASDDYLRIHDYDRPLKSKGILQAHQMSSKLKTRLEKPDMLLSSTASRAIQTAHIFAEAYQIPYTEIIHNKTIYEASVETLLKAIATIPDNVNRLLLFGHNPGLTFLANYLLDSIITDIPVCGIVCIKIESATWHELYKNKNHLEYIDIPDKIDFDMPGNSTLINENKGNGSSI